MHQTITSRKAIYIPHTVDVIPLDELASRLAATIHDPSGTDAEWSRHNDLTRVLKADFVRAGGAGQLVVRHPVAHVPVQPDTQGAVVLVDDAARYLAESGSRFRITRHIQALPFVGLHPLQPVPLADVPHMVARAMYPESDDEVMEVHGYGVTRFEVQSRIERAQMLGELTLINPTDGQPLPFSSPHACVAAGDLCDFFSCGAAKLPPSMALAPQPASSDWESFIYQSGYELTEEDANEAAAIVDAMRNPEDDFQLSTETISTRKGLLEAHGHEWPTLERDLRDAAVNGLAKAAKAGARGWLNSKALDWARSKGKLTSTKKTPPQQPASVFNVLTHKIKG